MATFLQRRPSSKKKAKTIASGDVTSILAGEFSLSRDKVTGILRSAGISLEGKNLADEMDLYREVIACKVGDLSRFSRDDSAYAEQLDRQLRSFDEIYVDTAPIIHEDWFLRFVSDATPILKRRKKRLIILEKTMEELHGLKDNPEKDKEVRIRATIRPDMLRSLARRGVVRIGDTGSNGIADDHLVQLFAKLGRQKNLLLITQDRGLSERIVNLAHDLASEPPAPVRTSFWDRLRGRKNEQQTSGRRLMMVCKLDETGALRRCYVCPECNESYYDEMLDCDGKVLCGRCYLALKERDAKREEEERRKQEAMLAEKEEEERQKERAEEKREPITVQQTLAKRKRKASLIALLLLLAILALSVMLL